MDGANDNLLVPGESLCEITAFAAAVSLDDCDNTRCAFEISDSVLQLPIDDVPIGDNQYRIEYFLICRIVQVSKKVR